MADHLEAGGDVFQHLTLVLADAAEQAATASRAGAGRLVCDGLAWQMRRQRGPGRVRRSRGCAGGSGMGVGGRGPRFASAASSSRSPISNSSCSISRSSFSEERPKRARRSTANCVLSCSMCRVLAWISAALAAISISLRASSACRLAANCRSSSGSIGSGCLPRDRRSYGLPRGPLVQGRTRQNIAGPLSNRDGPAWHIRRNRPPPIDRLDQ